jgi:hypothetical protein
MCLAGDIILLQRGGVNDNSPCTKHLVVVNIRATVKLFLNVLDMKTRVQDTDRLAFIYVRNKKRTYMAG